MTPALRAESLTFARSRLQHSQLLGIRQPRVALLSAAGTQTIVELDKARGAGIFALAPHIGVDRYGPSREVPGGRAGNAAELNLARTCAGRTRLSRSTASLPCRS